MKKLLIALGLISVATASFGQGEINFANSTTTRLTTNAVAGGPSTGSTSGFATATYYVAMFIANPSVTLANGSAGARSGAGQQYVFDDPAWTAIGVGTNIGIGRFGGGNGPQGGLLTGVAYPNQTSASFVAIAWSGNIGSSLTELRNWYGALGGTVPSTGWVGQSAVGPGLLIGGGPAAPSTIFSPVAPNIPGWMLGIVPSIIPEPATFTLAGLGAAAMLILRRRK